MNKPVCLIVGAGAGIGGNVAKRFAREGYHACLARRTDKAGLDRMVAEIEAEGGSATGFILNAVEEGSIEFGANLESAIFIPFEGRTMVVAVLCERFKIPCSVGEF